MEDYKDLKSSFHEEILRSKIYLFRQIQLLKPSSTNLMLF